MDPYDSSELRSSSLQLSLNRYPASRWQQLRQTLGAGSTSPSQLRASFPGLSDPDLLPKPLRISSSIHDADDNATRITQPGLLQEAADVLRRCTDTGAALQAHETQLAAAALSSLGHYSNSKDQFTIAANGSIHAAWADDEQQLEQLRNLQGSTAFSATSAADRLCATKPGSDCLYRPDALTADDAVAYGIAHADSQPAADRSPPRRLRSSPRKQQQQWSSPQQQHHHGNQHATAMKGSSMRSSHGRVTSIRVSSTVPRPAAATAAAGLAVLAEHDKQLLQQLAHDLAALLARKLLHRWQQHTADAKVDRARAKPMQKLLRWVAYTTPPA
jgi:hypothetical protein